MPDELIASIQIGGRRLRYRTVGTGPDLLLINGYGGTAADWDPTFIGALAQRYQVVSPDNRGIGGSDLGDPADCTVAGMGDDVIALMDALQIETAPLVGWSMGGFVAQHVALRHPQRVSALVLMATDPGGPAAVTADPRVWRSLTDRSGTPRERASRMISVLFPPDVAAAIDAAFGDVVAAAGASLSADALAAQERATDRWHAETPGPVTVPPRVLAIGGSVDRVIPPANQAALAARWPGARLLTVEDGGHAFMAQQPEQVARWIREFADDRQPG